MAVSDVDLVPTDAMARAAEKGLRLRDEYGRGGTEVGVARARDLINKKSLSPRTVKRMHSYFSRHSVDKKGKGWGKDSAGYIAWLLWGGDPGESWAARKVKEIDKASGATSEHARFGVSKIDTCPLSVNRYDPDMINMSRTHELLGFAAKPAVFSGSSPSTKGGKIVKEVEKKVGEYSIGGRVVKKRGAYIAHVSMWKIYKDDNDRTKVQQMMVDDETFDDEVDASQWIDQTVKDCISKAKRGI